MVELKHLQKVIGQNTVVEIEALAVSAGEIAAIVGPAGSGETALFDLLLGRTRPTMGTVQVAGIDPAQDKHEFSQRVGVLFAEDSLYKNRSPLANGEQIRAENGVDNAVGLIETTFG
jgi:ABC-type multidrug transport system ATPase subunit